MYIIIIINNNNSAFFWTFYVFGSEDLTSCVSPRYDCWLGFVLVRNWSLTPHDSVILERTDFEDALTNQLIS